MFDELEKLINSDKESQDRFISIRNDHDENQRRSKSKRQKSARIQAIVLASSSVVSILFLVYAFNIETTSKKAIAELEIQIEKVTNELNDCMN